MPQTVEQVEKKEIGLGQGVSAMFFSLAALELLANFDKIALGYADVVAHHSDLLIFASLLFLGSVFSKTGLRHQNRP